MKQPAALPAFLKIISDTNDSALHHATLVSLQQFDSPEVAAVVLQHLNEFGEIARNAALSLLTCRPSWAFALLQAVAQGSISPSTIPGDLVNRLKAYQDSQIASLTQKLWKTERTATTAEMQQQIKHYAEVVRGGSGDPYAGRSTSSAAPAALATNYSLRAAKSGPTSHPLNGTISKPRSSTS